MSGYLLGTGIGLISLATLGSTSYAAKNDPSFRNFVIGSTIVLIIAIIALYYSATNQLSSPIDTVGFGIGMVVLMLLYSGLGIWSWPFTFKAMIKKFNEPDSKKEEIPN